MEPQVYVLIAEETVRPMIGVVCEALLKHARPTSLHIVVPETQVERFHSAVPGCCNVVPESALLPDWPLSRVAAMLPNAPQRAGWYLQQFLKLQFGAWAGVKRYVIWDADTVLLQPLELTRGEGILINKAREYNPAYFETYRRMFGRSPVLESSVISQYMLVDSDVIAEMTRELQERHHKPWVEAILSVLPGKSLSEFSEYETYANYRESRFPGSVILQKQKWFRYGAEVMPDPTRRRLSDIEGKFRKFAYVAFERRSRGILARAACNIANVLRVTN